VLEGHLDSRGGGGGGWGVKCAQDLRTHLAATKRMAKGLNATFVADVQRRILERFNSHVASLRGGGGGGRLSAADERSAIAKGLYEKEARERRRLLNLVQELKGRGGGAEFVSGGRWRCGAEGGGLTAGGNIRVFCRVRPVLPHEGDSAIAMKFHGENEVPQVPLLF
jgi:hypothetical protein